MTSNKSFFLAFFLLPAFCITATAQTQTGIVAGVDSAEKQIIVKWFSEQVIFPQGVHVYRSRAGQDWVRLTARPLRRGDMPVPQTLLQNDSVMRAFVEAAQSASNNDLRGIIGAMMMVQAVQNNYYARFLGLCYIDEDVASGVSYRYRVMQVQTGGRETLVGETDNIIAGQYLPVAPPQGLTVIPGDGETELKWIPEPQRFFGVNVYRRSNRDTQPVKANSDMILISENEGEDGAQKYPDVFFTDQNLDNNYQYTYFIRGIDYLGQEGAPSEPVTVAPQDQTPPEPPVNVTVSVDGLNVSLAWENPDPSPDMEGYHVYRSKRMDSGYVRANRTILDRNTFSFIDRLEDPGQYFYYVAAVDYAGNEGESFKDMADVKDVYPPSAPRGLTAQADSGKITLRWLANTEKDLMGYQVFRTVDRNNTANYVLVNAQPLTDTVFVDMLPAISRNMFHYRVAAIDSSFNRSDYSAPTFGAMPDLTPPARPLIRSVSQMENALLVEWIPNAEDDLKWYNIYRMNMNDSVTMHLNPRPVSRSVNRFTDLQVNPNIPYRYYITATDSSNNVSAPSEYFYATFVQDEEPTAVNNPLTSFRASHNARQKQVALRWRFDGRPSLKGVIVFRSDGTNFVPLTGLLHSGDYTDKDIAEGNRYTYRLHVFFNSGEVFRSEEIVVSIK